MTRIKICGITNLEDALMAAELGANTIGFVFAESPRQIRPEIAQQIISSLPPSINKAGVFVDEKAETVEYIIKFCRLTEIQLHGNESKEYLDSISIPSIKAFRVKNENILDQIESFNIKRFLLDSFHDSKAGGTGKSFEWGIARKASKLGKVILSGGLTPVNIVSALEAVKPYGVDVSSGVESHPGKKDHDKMQQFIKEVRNWDN
jgi:phosphoribosylanthranilate isomerase